MRFLVISASVLALALSCPAPTFAQATHQNAGSSATTSTPSANSGTQGFKTQAEARTACGGQQVVWANTSSHVLHTAGSKYYGKTKHGAYMCENTAIRAGYHMAKSER